MERMNKWRIYSKKDWIIAFVFLTLIVYSLTIRYSFRINEYMIRFLPDKFNNLNQPHSNGNVIITISVMTVIILLILIRKRKQIRILVCILLLGLLLDVIVFSGFLIHCKLIVSTPKTEKAVSAVICYPEVGSIELEAGDVRLEKIVKLAYAMKPLPEKKQRELRQTFSSLYSSDSVVITFPPKYGHTYIMFINFVGDNIYMIRGHGPNTTYYYKDNGFLEYIKGLK